MNIVQEYQRKLRILYMRTPIPGESEIRKLNDHRAELHRRISQDPFDGGYTVQWLSGLGEKAVYISVQDITYGHIIHLVSDRAVPIITEEIRKAIHIMRWLSQQPLTWFWWDHPWKRLLPRNTIPSRDHINGGWAVPGVPEIHVYRREEAHKVLIHEIIHAIQLDIPHTRIYPVLHQFETDLQRKLWPHLGEAYTEFYAEFLWAVFISTSLGDAQRNWKYQLRCSAKQAQQIWSRIYSIREDENTNVFAYYVLKWVLMQHTPEVLLSPNGSLQHWFRWWKELQPTIKKDMISIQRDLSLGMTCDVESH